jgi:nucleotide-binding universal stress UspA family protein
MIRTILVPLDGFVFGEHALPMALAVARHARAPIKLLHVMQPFVEVVPELSAYQGPLLDEYKQEKQRYLDGVVRRVREVADVPVSSELIEGEIAPTIRDVVSDGKADLVVMTTHGRGPVARFWLGSVADEMVRELPVPLLLVHPGKEAPDFSKEPSLEHLLLTLDGTPLAEQIIPPAVDLAKAMNAEISLLRVIRTEVPADFGFEHHGYIMSEQAQRMVEELEAIQRRQMREAERYLEGVAEGIRARGVAVTTKVVLDETPATTIVKEAKGADVVALETHGHGGLRRLWRGSVADKVLRKSPTAVLVQHPQE